MDRKEVLARLEKIRADALVAISAATSLDEIRAAEVGAMGRKSAFAEIGRGLRDFSGDDRRSIGQLSNEVREAIKETLEERTRELRGATGESESIDISLPGRRGPVGRQHPITTVQDEIIDTFVGLGFNVAEGPVVETDHYNFEALNFPPDHPARSMHDTFYVASPQGESLLLRTHTSPMQVRLMESTPPPLYVVIPGVCARRDEVDANHVSVFSQIEGLAVDQGISFADLKGTLEVFAKAMFGPNLRVRTHPSYFPFTEPSAEVYVSCFSCDGSGCRTCRWEGWIEIMGAGMVHPNVLRGVGYNPDLTGFAFGMGVERIAKLRYSVSDLRSFYENDLKFLQAFT